MRFSTASGCSPGPPAIAGLLPVDDGIYMTDRATDPAKQLSSVLCFGRPCRGFVPRGRFQGTHETCEVINILQIVIAGIRQAVRFGDLARIMIWSRGRDRRVAGSGHFGLLQTARNSHLVQISISSEGQQARMLVLPSKTPDAVFAFDLPEPAPSQLARRSSGAWICIVVCGSSAAFRPEWPPHTRLRECWLSAGTSVSSRCPAPAPGSRDRWRGH